MCECEDCGAAYPAKRAALGYRLCLTCGERAAREVRAGWCVAPVHKSNYVLISNKTQLVGLNNKVPPT